MIISRDKNISSSIYIAINEDKKKKADLAKYKQVEKKPLTGLILSKHDPYLHKLCEMIYSNIKSRF